MDEKEFLETILVLANSVGLKRKISILRLLKKECRNVFALSRLLGVKSFSHVRKYLVELEKAGLVSNRPDEWTDENYGMKHSRKEFFITERGLSFLLFFRDIGSVDFPEYLLDLMKAKIRNSIKYKELRKKKLEINPICEGCNSADNLEVHHLKGFSDIIRENQILSLNSSYRCLELWDINNLKTLCSSCHRCYDIV